MLSRVFFALCEVSLQPPPRPEASTIGARRPFLASSYSWPHPASTTRIGGGHQPLHKNLRPHAAVYRASRR